MALPTVVINNGGTGSDTQASGAGPATAVFGTAATVTNTSSSVSITDAVALGSVATDGSAALWVSTASGRRWSKITAISGSSGSWTLTVEDTVWTSGSALTWAIGGQRNSLQSASLLFADAKGGWTIDVQNGGSAHVLTSVITFSAGGDSTTNGFLTLKSTSGTPATITTATNSTILFNLSQASTGCVSVRNIYFTNTAGTSAGAFTMTTGNNSAWVEFWDCQFTGFTTAIDFSSRPPATQSVKHCTFVTCSASGVKTGTGTAVFDSCLFISCSTAGISWTNTNTSVRRCSFSGCGIGINCYDTSHGNVIAVDRCNFYNTTTHGISMSTVSGSAYIVADTCAFYSIGGYGISLTNSFTTAGNAVTCRVNNCAGGSLTSGLATSNIPIENSQSALTGNPWIDPGNGDFRTNNTAGAGAALRGAGFASSYVGYTGFMNYTDIGAFQHKDTPDAYILNQTINQYFGDDREW